MKGSNAAIQQSTSGNFKDSMHSFNIYFLLNFELFLEVTIKNSLDNNNKLLFFLNKNLMNLFQNIFVCVFVALSVKIQILINGKRDMMFKVMNNHHYLDIENKMDGLIYLTNYL